MFFSLFYSSLTCKLWILFRKFQDIWTWTVLKYYRIFGTIYKINFNRHISFIQEINFNRQPVFSYFLLVNKLYNLNLFKLQKNSSDISRSLSTIYIWGLLTLFVYGKFNLTIKYGFSFFWSSNCASLVCKLYISIRFVLDFWAVLISESFCNCIF